MQWYGTILPRIHSFLPAARIVEIGPGKGRLSQFLQPYATKELILSDITEACVSACAERFDKSAKVSCYLTDGTNLGPVEPTSVDFVFSLYSLVHADDATMHSYIVDLADKLSENGAAFIHHSNAAICLSGNASHDKRLNEYRDTSVSADRIDEFARAEGLYCKSQELFGWDDDSALTDCFSVITRPRSGRTAERALIYNWEFSAEARRWGTLARAYSVDFLGASS
jgi:SAM-dependent methyltransferase